ncbi:uncharacterized protein [Argopecten irradians]|uniref:uncharacterized protein n=1 Tax=Argopecten irradians TaxID=31199 RepID=UPI0037177CC6
MNQTGLRYTFDCDCWIKKGDKRQRNSKECYYDQPIANCRNTPARVECHIGKCTRCNDGYFIDGYAVVVSACGRIPDCSNTLCRSRSDRWCTRCRDADLFKLDNGGRSCARTCSWEDRWCWPGTCGSPDTHNYARNCACDSINFRRVYDSTQARCELKKSPKAVTCRMKIIDENNGERMSLVSPDQPNHCSNQNDFYGNIQVKQIFTETKFDFLVDVSNFNSTKPKFVMDYAFGVTDVHFHIVRKPLSGSDTVKTFSIKEDTNSNNPLSHVTYDRMLVNSFSLRNGQRLCLRYIVQGGGHMISKNVQTNTLHSVPYPKTSTTRELCYWYDDAPPEHCLEHSVCGTEPLDTASRILTSRNFTVTFTGWDDPSPVPGDPKFASGIHTYVVNMYEAKEAGPDYLNVGRTPVIPAVEQTSPVDITIPSNLPNPAMYTVVLEVKDIAGNVRQARRFVLFDNSSKVVTRDDRPFYSTTASQGTGYKWQTNLGQICYSWTDRFINDKFYHLNLLKPIKADYHGLISGIYEQTTGLLPVSGTENVHGLTRFRYTLSRDDDLIIQETDVPNFTSQMLCISPTLSDGETYRLHLMTEDIMSHSYEESVTIHIDSSEPDIADVWLEKVGYERLFVHNSIDLSEMTLTFKAIDVHSGIHTVDWSLGAVFGGNDIGQGSLSVQRLDNNLSCPSDATTCYCPTVGPCAYYNFTVDLNSLIHGNTHIGNHNRQYHFTITVTNVARLFTIDHLEVLADDSPPAPGVVMEGVVGTPDIDYISEETVIVSWAGFIDHESGIKLYKVGLATECLEDADFVISNSMNNDTHLQETTIESVRVSLPQDGKYYVTVVAYNNAMEPSKPVCSDGIVLDRTKPKLVNLTLQSATMRETIICSDGSAWFITANLTKHEMNDTDHSDYCMNSTTNDFVSSLPLSISDSTDVSALTNNISNSQGIIYLPIDMMNIKWDIVESESQIHGAFVGIGSTRDSVVSPDLIDYQKTHHKYFFKKRHTGLSNGDEFYIFIRITNSAGLETTAVIGPVLLDESPPNCPPNLLPTFRGDHLLMEWNRNEFDDNEQQEDISSFSYRIGRQGRLVSGLQYLMYAECGDRLCFQIDLSDIQEYDLQEQFEFYLQVYAFNDAGYHCTVDTKPFYLPSILPPGHGLVYDVISDKNSHQNDYVDVEVILATSRLCVTWTGFEHHGAVEYEFGVGLSPGADDIIPFHQVDVLGIYCESFTNLTNYVQYFTAIRASSTGGERVGISNGFILVKESDIDSSILKVYDGLGCSEQKGTLNTTLFVTEDLELFAGDIQFHVGHTYNFVSNASISVDSTEADIYNQTQVQQRFYVSFVPLISFPRFNLTSNDGENAYVSINVLDCVIDHDIMFVSDHPSVYWYNDDFHQYVSYYEVELRVSSRDNKSQTDHVTMAYGKTSGNAAVYIFNDVSLRSGRYIISIRPCIGEMCFRWTSSDGFVVTDATYDEFSVEANLHKIDDTCSFVNIALSNLECPSGIAECDVIAQWGIFQNKIATLQVTPWISHTFSDNLNNSTISQCIELPRYPHQQLYTCVEIHFPDGPSGIECVSLTVTEDPNIFDKTILYEIDSDLDIVNDIKGSIHASNLGHKLAWLHETELDFSAKPVRVGGIILGLGDRPVTWYLLKDKKDQLTCENNPLCVAVYQTVGGFCAFQGIELENEMIHYICAKVQSYTSPNGQILAAFQTCGDGFVFDENPPEKGDVIIISQNRYITNSRHMLVHWDGFQDFHGYKDLGYPDSISRYEYSIGSNPHGQDVVAKKTIGHSNSVTNKAGLSTLASSDPFVFDRSAPAPGTVRDGVNVEKPDIDFQSNTTHAGCHWSGFSDPHSGVLYYTAGLGTQPSEDDVRSMTSTGTQTAIRWQHTLVPGEQHFCTVQACNGAGICTSVSSNGFTTDSSPPIPGVVHVGIDGHHSRYWPHPDTIQAQWFGFSDVESGIRRYEVCIRSVDSETCDILPFTNFLLANYMTTAVSLPLDKTMCVVVRAENHLGMSTESVSNSFVVDSTPPNMVSEPVIRTDGGYASLNNLYQFDPSVLHLSWKFQDSESPIVKHIVSITTHHEGHTPIENVNLPNINELRISLPNKDWLRPGDTYIARVTACNEAGLCISETSNSLLIDPTPPHLGGITEPMTWYSVTTSGKSVSAMEITLSGFIDVESRVKLYHVTVGKTYSGSELSNGVLSFTPSDKDTETIQVVLNDSIRPGQLLIITVWAENHAGLKSSVGKVTVTVISSNNIDMNGELEILKHSCDVHYCNKDCTCAVVEQKCHDVGIHTECKINNQTSSLSMDIEIMHGSKNAQISPSSSCISARWTVDGADVHNIMRYEWSMGQYDFPIGTGIFDPLHESLWYDVEHQTSIVHCLRGERFLKHDTSYVVYVRAWMSVSEFIGFTSSPVHIDNTPPSVRMGRFIRENDEGTCDHDLDFTTTLDTLTACWGNVFRDPQSGIYSYLVALGTSPGGDDVIITTNVGLNTSKSWPDLTLSPGTTYMYYVTVTATNQIGLHTALVSDGVLVDNETPYTGVVYNTDKFYNTYVQNSRHIGVSLRGFDDRHSAIESFFVAVDKSNNSTIASLQWECIGLQNTFTFHNIILTDGQFYRFAVKAIDSAGFESEIIFSPPAMFDSSPPNGVWISELSNLYNETLAAENGTVLWTKMIDRHEHTSVYKLQVIFDGMGTDTGTTVNVTFENQRHIFTTQETINGEHRFNTTLESSAFFNGTRSISFKTEIIHFGVKVNVILDVMEFKARVDNTEDVVKVSQVSPTELNITVNVMDKESGIKDIYVAAGSTPGGFQLHPLVLVPRSSNKLLFTEVPHGQEVYVTAKAENHAGDQSHFHAKAFVMDHTPPQISNAQMTMTYESSGGISVTKINITWDTYDIESSSTECSCDIVEHTNQTVIAGIDNKPMLNQLQTEPLHLTHGIMISAHITCYNDADLHQATTVGPKLISYRPPDVQKAAIFIDTKAETVAKVPVLYSSSPLMFTWEGIDDSFGIKGYSYRILQGGRVTKDWEDTEMRTSVSVEDISLADNHLYTVEVMASNYAGVYSEVINASILILGDVPSLTGHYPRVSRTGDILEIVWSDVFVVRPDLVPTYVVTLGSELGFADVIRRLDITEEHHMLETVFTGSDVYAVITCGYQTGKFVIFQGKLPVS